jgi:hypothetical protein
MDMSGELITGILIGVVLPVVGYFAKRWFEGTSDAETLARANIALDLKKTLSERGMSASDINPAVNEAIERMLHQRERQSDIAAQVIAEATGNGKIITQADMTNYAVRAAAVANAKMELAFAGLLQELDDALKPQYEDSQRAWRKFAEKQSAAAAAHYEGARCSP